MRRRGVLFLGPVVLVLALAASAQADWAESYHNCVKTYVGIYGGGAYIPDTDVDIGAMTFADQEFDTGYLVGGKIGWWANRLPWLAWELNVWNTWTSTDLSLLNFSGSLLLQWLGGPVRIYGGGGVLGTWAELTNAADEDDLAVGAVGQAGLEYTLNIPIEWGVFAEYRYSWNSFEFADETLGKVDINPNRHEFIGGVNFRF
jgi:opacity protein-like surface antigen